MIRLGIVGCNYGRMVLLPAFRTDPRCTVVALAGTDAARTAALAKESGIEKSFGRWDELVADKSIDAIAIATPPQTQPGIAIAALKQGKAVFAEKPLATNMADADAILAAAKASKRPVMIDFEFPELPAWQRAKSLIDGGAIGTLRQVIVTWHVESKSTQLRLKGWKSTNDEGGGALGNFVSHCFHYLEYFCGPIHDLSARTFGLPDDETSETSVALSGRFSGGGTFVLSMSTACFAGSGHRIEFYGEDGAVVLSNAGADYMRGFELFRARRPDATLMPIRDGVDEEAKFSDGRIAPVSRLASRFIDAIEKGTQPLPGIAEGVRVQNLIEAARHSSNNEARTVTTQP